MSNKYGDFVSALKKTKKVDIELLSEEASCNVEEWVDSGCVPLNKILGGGYPVGRITEIFGDTSTGKSLLGSQAVAMAQQDGHMVLYIDTESAVSIYMMRKVGVDVDKLMYTAPDTVEDVFDYIDAVIETKRIKFPDELLLIVWDSVAGTSSRDEMEKSTGNVGYLQHARVISQAMRKFTRIIAHERVCAIFINQTREKLGVMFGDKKTTFGGNAISFHSSVRLSLTLASKIKRPNKKIIGIETKAYTVKNKTAAPFQQTTLPIYFGVGVDDALASYYWLDEQGYFEGKTWKTMELGGKTVKFQKSTWDKVYDEHFDEIVDIIMDSEDDLDEFEVEEE